MLRALLVLILFACAIVGLGAQEPPKPTILNVTMSAAGDQLTISGSGFGSAPLVTIDGQPATVISATDTQVSVVTPAVLLTTSGTYRLTVVDSVRQVGEAFVVASHSEKVLSFRSSDSATSGGGIGQVGSTSVAALTPTTGGTVTIAAIENGSPYFATALGVNALHSNTTGNLSTAIGYSALYSNTTGSYNTASGPYTLTSNTTGYNNTASGMSALTSNTTGFLNTASGTLALASNTTGENNTASGADALFSSTGASWNTAFGVSALYSNTGFYNTATGWNALISNTTGNYNTATGVNALYNNTTGIANTALGRYAGFNATTGNYNLYLGTNVQGLPADTNTIRLGVDYDGTTSPPSGNNQTFIAGIRGTAISGGFPVVVDANGKMGTAGGTTALSVLDASNTQPFQLRLGNLAGTSDYGIGRNPSDGVLDFTATQGTYSGFRFNTSNAGTALAIANNGVVSILDRTNTQPYQLRLGYINGVYDYAIGRNPNDGYLNFAGSQGTYSGYRFNTPNSGPVLTIANSGNIGIGVTAPLQPLQLASGAYVSAGGVWTNASSRTLKDRIAPLSTAEAVQTVADLSPVTFVYKAAPSESHVGFIAEDVPDLVATQDRRSLATMDVVAVVTKVVQDQQRQLHNQDQQLHNQEQQLSDRLQRLQEQNATVADLRARLARLEALLNREP